MPPFLHTLPISGGEVPYVAPPWQRLQEILNWKLIIRQGEIWKGILNVQHLDREERWSEIQNIIIARVVVDLLLRC